MTANLILSFGANNELRDLSSFVSQSQMEKVFHSRKGFLWTESSLEDEDINIDANISFSSVFHIVDLHETVVMLQLVDSFYPSETLKNIKNKPELSKVSKTRTSNIVLVLDKDGELSKLDSYPSISSMSRAARRRKTANWSKADLPDLDIDFDFSGVCKNSWYDNSTNQIIASIITNDGLPADNDLPL